MTDVWDWRSAGVLLADGISPEAISCIGCGRRWDGRVPLAPPCCAGCRAAAAQLLIAGIDEALRQLDPDGVGDIPAA